GKRVWTREAPPEVTWYGWDGDRLTTTQTDAQRIQTIYMPGSFTPLVRVETPCAELAKAARRTLAEKFQQEANVTFPSELVAMVDNLEAELQRGELSDANRAWLAQCGLTPEQIQNQMEPEYTPLRKIHLYHCDHRGLPLALVSHEGATEWEAEYDARGNMLRDTNPHNLAQLIRLPGQQYDEETGLYYNRHRYYDPQQGRYITQDPIGLRGGWNLYQYPLNPVVNIDPLGVAETAESYVVSRDLAALGDEARSRWNPLTHTFTVTTDGQGNILHTYSWGNDANLKGWNLDQSIDLKTAREALDSGLAQPTLAPGHCVEQAYNELNKKENEHINLFITRNCKQETNKLLFKAMAICTNKAWRASPFSLKPGMYGYSY
ncbi:RHS repeat-associated core domain-containing protein, partial [Enterobacter cloacae]